MGRLRVSVSERGYGCEGLSIGSCVTDMNCSISGWPSAIRLSIATPSRRANSSSSLKSYSSRRIGISILPVWRAVNKEPVVIKRYKLIVTHPVNNRLRVGHSFRPALRRIEPGHPPAPSPRPVNCGNEPAVAHRVAKDARHPVAIDRCRQARYAQVLPDKQDIGAEVTTGARSAPAGGNPEQPVEVLPVLSDLFIALLARFLTLLIRLQPRSTSCTSRAGTSAHCQSLVNGTHSALYE